MSKTPEAKIKAMVREVLAVFEGEPQDIDDFKVPELYQYWPVPAGFGKSSLDCLVTYRGISIGIETKAPGKPLTPRQKFTAAEIKGGGGTVFRIDGEEGCRELRTFLY